MKNFLLGLFLWVVAMAVVYFAYYNRAITEYRKIDPVTGEQYGEIGYYTDWGAMAMTAGMITAIALLVLLVLWFQLKKRKKATPQ